MGAVLPKAVTPIVLERHAGKLFRVGFAEMNGWRKNMEDAHVIAMKDTWSFFGVFDGHGGDQCSDFIMKRLYKELEGDKPPADDAAMKEIMLRLDRDFLATQQPSGSTGTFAMVTPLNGDDAGKYQLRVGNIGDSRVLLGRADGTIVEGPGTDFGLTTDHKPDHPDERARIYRTGGTVEVIQGCARVNGDLAVSRAFGDAPHKGTGGPAQEDHPVTVDPEFMTITCGATDFLMLVCDGISEGEFPNPEVVKLAAERLRDGGDKVDPAAAAAAVCNKAIERGSKDNLSCMIVLLGGGELDGPERALLSGPMSEPTHGGFRNAYEAMAKHAGLSLAQSVELRYDDVRKERVEKLKTQSPGDTDSLESLRKELLAYGDGPPSDLACGSEERTQWFKSWLDGHQVEEDPDPSKMTRQQLLDLVENRPDLLGMAQAQGALPARVVKVAPETELKAAIDATPHLRWKSDHAKLCDEHGIVIYDEEADGISRVKFPNQGFFVWLPTSALEEVMGMGDGDADGRMVKVAAVEELKPAIDTHSALKWFPKLADACGQIGVVLEDDKADGTSKVQFPQPINIIAWLPTSTLTDIEDSDSDDDNADAIQGDAEEITQGASEEIKPTATQEATSDGSPACAEEANVGSTQAQESSDPSPKRQRTE